MSFSVYRIGFAAGLLLTKKCLEGEPARNDSQLAFGKLHCPLLRLVVAEPTCDTYQERLIVRISHLFKYY